MAEEVLAQHAGSQRLVGKGIDEDEATGIPVASICVHKEGAGCASDEEYRASEKES